MTSVKEVGPDDAPAVTALYEDYEWWVDRDVADVREALLRSDVAVGIDDGGLVAAARVLTDRVYYATVYDVVVAEARRGEGFGRRVMDAVIRHPDLDDVDHVTLQCRHGLVPFYESVGFERSESAVDVPEGGTERLVRMVHAEES